MIEYDHLSSTWADEDDPWKQLASEANKKGVYKQMRKEAEQSALMTAGDKHNLDYLEGAEDSPGFESLVATGNASTDWENLNYLSNAKEGGLGAFGRSILGRAISIVPKTLRTVAAVAGIPSAIMEQSVDPMIDNAGTRMADEADEKLREGWFKTYNSRAYDSEDWLGKMSRPEFWRSDFADGAAFMLSSMAGGGLVGAGIKGAVKAAGLAGKIAKVASLTSKGKTLATAMNEIGLTAAERGFVATEHALATAGKATAGLVPGSISNLATTTLNTIGEASAEAMELKKSLREIEAKKLGYNSYEDVTDPSIKAKIDTQVAPYVARNFQGNAAGLFLTNSIETKALLGGRNSLRGDLGKMYKAGELTKPTAWNFAGTVGKNAIAENWEERMQLNQHRVLTDAFKEGKGAPNLIDLNLSSARSIVANIDEDEDTQAGILGSILGGAGGIREHIENGKDYAEGERIDTERKATLNGRTIPELEKAFAANVRYADVEHLDGETKTMVKDKNKLAQLITARSLDEQQVYNMYAAAFEDEVGQFEALRRDAEGRFAYGFLADSYFDNSTEAIKKAKETLEAQFALIEKPTEEDKKYLSDRLSRLDTFKQTYEKTHALGDVAYKKEGVQEEDIELGKKIAFAADTRKHSLEAFIEAETEKANQLGKDIPQSVLAAQKELEAYSKKGLEGHIQDGIKRAKELRESKLRMDELTKQLDSNSDMVKARDQLKENMLQNKAVKGLEEIISSGKITDPKELEKLAAKLAEHKAKAEAANTAYEKYFDKGWENEDVRNIIKAKQQMQKEEAEIYGSQEVRTIDEHLYDPSKQSMAVKAYTDFAGAYSNHDKTRAATNAFTEGKTPATPMEMMTTALNGRGTILPDTLDLLDKTIEKGSAGAFARTKEKQPAPVLDPSAVSNLVGLEGADMDTLDMHMQNFTQLSVSQMKEYDMYDEDTAMRVENPNGLAPTIQVLARTRLSDEMGEANDAISDAIMDAATAEVNSEVDGRAPETIATIEGFKEELGTFLENLALGVKDDNVARLLLDRLNSIEAATAGIIDKRIPTLLNAVLSSNTQYSPANIRNLIEQIEAIADSYDFSSGLQGDPHALVQHPLFTNGTVRNIVEGIHDNTANRNAIIGKTFSPRNTTGLTEKQTNKNKTQLATALEEADKRGIELQSEHAAKELEFLAKGTLNSKLKALRSLEQEYTKAKELLKQARETSEPVYTQDSTGARIKVIPRRLDGNMSKYQNHDFLRREYFDKETQSIQLTIDSFKAVPKFDDTAYVAGIQEELKALEAMYTYRFKHDLKNNSQLTKEYVTKILESLKEQLSELEKIAEKNATENRLLGKNTALRRMDNIMSTIMQIGPELSISPELTTEIKSLTDNPITDFEEVRLIFHKFLAELQANKSTQTEVLLRYALEYKKTQLATDPELTYTTTASIANVTPIPAELDLIRNFIQRSEIFEYNSTEWVSTNNFIDELERTKDIFKFSRDLAAYIKDGAKEGVIVNPKLTPADISSRLNKLQEIVNSLRVIKALQFAKNVIDSDANMYTVISSLERLAKAEKGAVVPTEEQELSLIESILSLTRNKAIVAAESTETNDRITAEIVKLMPKYVYPATKESKKLIDTLPKSTQAEKDLIVQIERLEALRPDKHDVFNGAVLLEGGSGTGKTRVFTKWLLQLLNDQKDNSEYVEVEETETATIPGETVDRYVSEDYSSTSLFNDLTTNNSTTNKDNSTKISIDEQQLNTIKSKIAEAENALLKVVQSIDTANMDTLEAINNIEQTILVDETYEEEVAVGTTQTNTFVESDTTSFTETADLGSPMSNGNIIVSPGTKSTMFTYKKLPGNRIEVVLKGPDTAQATRKPGRYVQPLFNFPGGYKDSKGFIISTKPAIFELSEDGKTYKLVSKGEVFFSKSDLDNANKHASGGAKTKKVQKIRKVEKPNEKRSETITALENKLYETLEELSKKKVKIKEEILALKLQLLDTEANISNNNNANKTKDKTTWENLIATSVNSRELDAVQDQIDLAGDNSNELTDLIAKKRIASNWMQYSPKSLQSMLNRTISSANGWTYVVSISNANSVLELRVYNENKVFVGRGKLLYNKEKTTMFDIQPTILSKVEDVVIDEVWRSKGYGTKLYEVFNDAVLTLTSKQMRSSDISLSTSAAHVWQSLVKRGLAVKLIDGFRFKDYQANWMQTRTRNAIKTLPHTLLVELAKEFSQRFNINVDVITPEQAVSILNFPIDKLPLGYYSETDKKAYIISGRADISTSLHEIFTHPFLLQIEKTNPKLFESLTKEVATDTSINAFLDMYYPNADARVRAHEGVARAMDLYSKRLLDARNSPALVRLIRKLFAEFKETLKQIFNLPQIKTEDLSDTLTIKDIALLVNTTKIKMNLGAELKKIQEILPERTEQVTKKVKRLVKQGEGGLDINTDVLALGNTIAETKNVLEATLGKNHTIEVDKIKLTTESFITGTIEKGNLKIGNYTVVDAKTQVLIFDEVYAMPPNKTKQFFAKLTELNAARQAQMLPELKIIMLGDPDQIAENGTSGKDAFIQSGRLAKLARINYTGPLIQSQRSGNYEIFKLAQMYKGMKHEVAPRNTISSMELGSYNAEGVMSSDGAEAYKLTLEASIAADPSNETSRMLIVFDKAKVKPLQDLYKDKVDVRYVLDMKGEERQEVYIDATNSDIKSKRAYNSAMYTSITRGMRFVFINAKGFDTIVNEKLATAIKTVERSDPESTLNEYVDKLQPIKDVYNSTEKVQREEILEELPEEIIEEVEQLLVEEEGPEVSDENLTPVVVEEEQQVPKEAEPSEEQEEPINLPPIIELPEAHEIFITYPNALAIRGTASTKQEHLEEALTKFGDQVVVVKTKHNDVEAYRAIAISEGAYVDMGIVVDDRLTSKGDALEILNIVSSTPMFSKTQVKDKDALLAKAAQIKSGDITKPAIGIVSTKSVYRQFNNVTVGTDGNLSAEQFEEVMQSIKDYERTGNEKAGMIDHVLNIVKKHVGEERIASVTLDIPKSTSVAWKHSGMVNIVIGLTKGKPITIPCTTRAVNIDKDLHLVKALENFRVNMVMLQETFPKVFDWTNPEDNKMLMAFKPALILAREDNDYEISEDTGVLDTWDKFQVYRPEYAKKIPRNHYVKFRGMALEILKGYYGIEYKDMTLGKVKVNINTGELDLSALTLRYTLNTRDTNGTLAVTDTEFKDDIKTLHSSLTDTVVKTFEAQHANITRVQASVLAGHYLINPMSLSLRSGEVLTNAGISSSYEAKKALHLLRLTGTKKKDGSYNESGKRLDETVSAFNMSPSYIISINKAGKLELRSDQGKTLIRTATISANKGEAAQAVYVLGRANRSKELGLVLEVASEISESKDMHISYMAKKLLTAPAKLNYTVAKLRDIQSLLSMLGIEGTTYADFLESPLNVFAETSEDVQVLDEQFRYWLFDKLEEAQYYYTASAKVFTPAETQSFEEDYATLFKSINDDLDSNNFNEANRAIENLIYAANQLKYAARMDLDKAMELVDLLKRLTDVELTRIQTEIQDKRMTMENLDNILSFNSSNGANVRMRVPVRRTRIKAKTGEVNRHYPGVVISGEAKGPEVSIELYNTKTKQLDYTNPIAEPTLTYFNDVLNTRLESITPTQIYIDLTAPEPKGGNKSKDKKRRRGNTDLLAMREGNDNYTPDFVTLQTDATNYAKQILGDNYTEGILNFFTREIIQELSMGQSTLGFYEDGKIFAAMAHTGKTDLVILGHELYHKVFNEALNTSERTAVYTDLSKLSKLNKHYFDTKQWRKLEEISAVEYQKHIKLNKANNRPSWVSTISQFLKTLFSIFSAKARMDLFYASVNAGKYAKRTFTNKKAIRFMGKELKSFGSFNRAERALEIVENAIYELGVVGKVQRSELASHSIYTEVDDKIVERKVELNKFPIMLTQAEIMDYLLNELAFDKVFELNKQVRDDINNEVYDTLEELFMEDNENAYEDGLTLLGIKDTVITLDNLSNVMESIRLIQTGVTGITESPVDMGNIQAVLHTLEKTKHSLEKLEEDIITYSKLTPTNIKYLYEIIYGRILDKGKAKKLNGIDSELDEDISKLADSKLAEMEILQKLIADKNEINWMEELPKKAKESFFGIKYKEHGVIKIMSWQEAYVRMLHLLPSQQISVSTNVIDLLNERVKDMPRDKIRYAAVVQRMAALNYYATNKELEYSAITISEDEYGDMVEDSEDVVEKAVIRSAVAISDAIILAVHRKAKKDEILPILGIPQGITRGSYTAVEELKAAKKFYEKNPSDIYITKEALSQDIVDFLKEKDSVARIMIFDKAKRERGKLMHSKEFVKHVQVLSGVSPVELYSEMVASQAQDTWNTLMSHFLSLSKRNYVGGKYDTQNNLGHNYDLNALSNASARVAHLQGAIAAKFSPPSPNITQAEMLRKYFEPKETTITATQFVTGKFYLKTQVDVMAYADFLLSTKGTNGKPIIPVHEAYVKAVARFLNFQLPNVTWSDLESNVHYPLVDLLLDIKSSSSPTIPLLQQIYTKVYKGVDLHSEYYEKSIEDVVADRASVLTKFVDQVDAGADTVKNTMVKGADGKNIYEYSISSPTTQVLNYLKLRDNSLYIKDIVETPEALQDAFMQLNPYVRAENPFKIIDTVDWVHEYVDYGQFSKTISFKAEDIAASYRRVFLYGYLTHLSKNNKGYMQFGYTRSNKKSVIGAQVANLSKEDKIDGLVQMAKQLLMRPTIASLKNHNRQSFTNMEIFKEHLDLNKTYTDEQLKKLVADKIIPALHKAANSFVDNMLELDIALPDIKIHKSSFMRSVLPETFDYEGLELLSEYTDHNSEKGYQTAKTKALLLPIAEEFYVDNYISSYFISQLTIGDSAFYGNAGAVVKRFSIMDNESQSAYVGEGGMKDSINLMIVNDASVPTFNKEGATTNTFESILDTFIEQGHITAEQKKNILSQASDDSTPTDGVVFSLPTTGEELVKGFGESYARMSVQKPVISAHVKVKGKQNVGGVETEVSVNAPLAIKCAIFEITPQLERENPKLAQIAKNMRNMKLDLLVMQSASKVWVPAETLHIDDFSTGDIDQVAEASKINDGSKLTVKSKNLRLQLNPKHEFDEQLKIYSQLLYFTNPTNKTAEETKVLYEYIGKIIRIGTQKYLRSEQFAEEDKGLLGILKSAMQGSDNIELRNLLTEFAEAGVKGVWNYPGISQLSMNRFAAYLTKNVITVKFTGNDAILHPDYGIEVKGISNLNKAALLRKGVTQTQFNKLVELKGKGTLTTEESVQLVELNKIIEPALNEEQKKEVDSFRRALTIKPGHGGIVEAEVLLPRGYLPTHMEKQLEEQLAKGMRKPLFDTADLLAWRIPTSELHNGVSIVIAGFYEDRYHSNVIITPKELTLLHGSDFDIDSLWLAKRTYIRQPKYFGEARKTFAKLVLEEQALSTTYKETAAKVKEEEALDKLVSARLFDMAAKNPTKALPGFSTYSNSAKLERVRHGDRATALNELAEALRIFQVEKTANKGVLSEERKEEYARLVKMQESLLQESSKYNATVRYASNVFNDIEDKLTTNSLYAKYVKSDYVLSLLDMREYVNMEKPEGSLDWKVIETYVYYLKARRESENVKKLEATVNSQASVRSDKLALSKTKSGLTVEINKEQIHFAGTSGTYFGYKTTQIQYEGELVDVLRFETAVEPALKLQYDLANDNLDELYADPNASKEAIAEAEEEFKDIESLYHEYLLNGSLDLTMRIMAKNTPRMLELLSNKRLEQSVTEIAELKFQSTGAKGKAALNMLRRNLDLSNADDNIFATYSNRVGDASIGITANFTKGVSYIWHAGVVLTDGSSFPVFKFKAGKAVQVGHVNEDGKTVVIDYANFSPYELDPETGLPNTEFFILQSNDSLLQINLDNVKTQLATPANITPSTIKYFLTMGMLGMDQSLRLLIMGQPVVDFMVKLPKNQMLTKTREKLLKYALASKYEDLAKHLAEAETTQAVADNPLTIAELKAGVLNMGGKSLKDLTREQFITQIRTLEIFEALEGLTTSHSSIVKLLSVLKQVPSDLIGISTLIEEYKKVFDVKELQNEFGGLDYSKFTLDTLKAMPINEKFPIKVPRLLDTVPHLAESLYSLFTMKRVYASNYYTQDPRIEAIVEKMFPIPENEERIKPFLEKRTAAYDTFVEYIGRSVEVPIEGVKTDFNKYAGVNPVTGEYLTGKAGFMIHTNKMLAQMYSYLMEQRTTLPEGLRELISGIAITNKFELEIHSKIAANSIEFNKMKAGFEQLKALHYTYSATTNEFTFSMDTDSLTSDNTEVSNVFTDLVQYLHLSSGHLSTAKTLAPLMPDEYKVEWFKEYNRTMDNLLRVVNKNEEGTVTSAFTKYVEHLEFALRIANPTATRRSKDIISIPPTRMKIEARALVPATDKTPEIPEVKEKEFIYDAVISYSNTTAQLVFDQVQKGYMFFSGGKPKGIYKSVYATLAKTGKETSTKVYLQKIINVSAFNKVEFSAIDGLNWSVSEFLPSNKPWAAISLYDNEKTIPVRTGHVEEVKVSKLKKSYGPEAQKAHTLIQASLRKFMKVGTVKLTDYMEYSRLDFTKPDYMTKVKELLETLIEPAEKPNVKNKTYDELNLGIKNLTEALSAVPINFALDKVKMLELADKIKALYDYYDTLEKATTQSTLELQDTKRKVKEEAKAQSLSVRKLLRKRAKEAVQAEVLQYLGENKLLKIVETTDANSETRKTVTGVEYKPVIGNMQPNTLYLEQIEHEFSQYISGYIMSVLRPYIVTEQNYTEGLLSRFAPLITEANDEMLVYLRDDASFLNPIKVRLVNFPANSETKQALVPVDSVETYFSKPENMAKFSALPRIAQFKYLNSLYKIQC